MLRSLPLLTLCACASLDPFVDTTDVGEPGPTDDSGAVDTEASSDDDDDDDDASDRGGVLAQACIDGTVPSSGTTAGSGNDADASCGGSTGSEVMLSFTAPEAGRWAFTLSGTFFDTVLYVLDGCGGRELVCADDDDAETVSVDLDAGQEVVVVIDAAGQGEGVYEIDASLAPDSEGACANGLDDDADGLPDCLDPDCEGKPACNEVCDDGVDNDSDGLPDCMDPSCFAEPNCVAPCADEVLTDALPLSYFGTTAGGGKDTDPTCSPLSDSRDRAYAFVAPADGAYTFDTFGSSFDTVLYLLDECGGRELACNDDDAAGTLESRFTGNMTAGQRVIIVIDGYLDQQGDFRLNITD
jgi:hypothetical protein